MARPGCGGVWGGCGAVARTIAPVGSYFFFEGFCERALPAAVLDVLLVRPSLKTFEAAVAAFALVTFFVPAILSPPVYINVLAHTF